MPSLAKFVLITGLAKALLGPEGIAPSLIFIDRRA